VSAVNNNLRTGAGWGDGSAGWRDATNGAFLIGCRSRSTAQDRPCRRLHHAEQLDESVGPPTLTFSLYGITAFSVQTWNGSAWVTQATVTGNNLVKRTVTFPAISTDRIRVNVNGAVDGKSRIMEIEAWGN
jgi:hypothetical protein